MMLHRHLAKREDFANSQNPSILDKVPMVHYYKHKIDVFMIINRDILTA